MIDEDTWLLVDLDNCLFQGATAWGHAFWFYDQVEGRVEKGMSREEAIADFYPEWIKSQEEGQVKPIEVCLIPLLRKLQENGIVIMGLTHRQPLIADLTCRQVASLGFTFAKTAPTTENFEPSIMLLQYTRRVISHDFFS